MAKFKSYLIALRPWSFSASLTPVLLGNALAFNSNFSLAILLLTLISALCVHGAGNLVNTYYDYKYGIDNENTNSDRTLVDKLLKPHEITKLGVLLYFIGSISFFILLFISTAKEEILSFIYFGGLSLSFLYTGGVGFKYMALGDLIIIITFGPLTVLYSYLAQIGAMSQNLNSFDLYVKPLFFALPLVLNTEAILHSNNTRDLDNDRKSGIFTLAIYLGFTASYILYVLLIFVPYLVFLGISLKMKNYVYLLPLITIRMAFDLEKDFRFRNLEHLPIKTAKLNLIFGIFYIVACFFA
ncbi:unnamed protein product [Brachionus calyciflorus]|uniref:UbiA prenyltransferase domain-containing protein 1 n=1 Tax=Brachionus calyciflorus TaxID=104777 RepID=A0A813MR35_9BILA|nr:unnamed protein product [Brachionus calyciflorus]